MHSDDGMGEAMMRAGQDRAIEELRQRVEKLERIIEHFKRLEEHRVRVSSGGGENIGIAWPD